MGRVEEPRPRQPRAFVRLARRMVELEHAEISRQVRAAEREGVEARPDQNVLAHISGHGTLETLLGVARAHDHTSEGRRDRQGAVQRDWIFLHRVARMAQRGPENRRDPRALERRKKPLGDGIAEERIPAPDRARPASAPWPAPSGWLPFPTRAQWYRVSLDRGRPHDPTACGELRAYPSMRWMKASVFSATSSHSTSRTMQCDEPTWTPVPCQRTARR